MVNCNEARISDAQSPSKEIRSWKILKAVCTLCHRDFCSKANRAVLTQKHAANVNPIIVHHHFRLNFSCVYYHPNLNTSHSFSLST